MNNINIAQSDPAVTDRIGEYEIIVNPTVNIIGGGFFALWGVFVTYMTLSSKKNGIASYVLAYLFLIIAIFFVFYVFMSIIRCKFIVKADTITQFFVFRKSKTYDISKITKVVVHGGKGSVNYRIYIGKKKKFTLNSVMTNMDLFLETLQQNNVPFK